jgi:hypothetical protein
MPSPMKRLLLGAAVIVGTLVSSASAIELTIHPGVGIGKVRLGMTKAQVERVLGRDRIVNERDGAYSEFGWDYGTFSVGFVRGRAVQVATSLANERTKKGVGVGATWLRLMRAYPGGRCAWNSTPNRPPWPEYLLGRRGGTQTLWVFKPSFVGEPLTVRQVVMRTTFRPLPQFNPRPGMLRCAGNWRNEPAPRASNG